MVDHNVYKVFGKFRPFFSFRGLRKLLKRPMRLLRSFYHSRSLTSVGAGSDFGSDLMIENKGEIKIGKNFSCGKSVRLAVYKGGSLIIGDNVFIGQNSVIDADCGNIEIQDNVLIADVVGVRASDHGIRLGILIADQDNVLGDVKIGSDVWIGRCASVLKGSVIPNGCVIGASSVVNKTLPKSHSVYVGAPAKYVRSRH